jgi:hypothetical protein
MATAILGWDHGRQVKQALYIAIVRGWECRFAQGSTNRQAAPARFVPRKLARNAKHGVKS